MMKNLLNILMLCCCIFLAACSNDDSPVDSGLQVIATSGIDFSAGGGEGTIVVSANGVISASSDQDWCSVTVEGSTVYVVAATSTEMTSRSALITISSESGFVEVPIVQSGLIIVMNEYNLYHSFTYEGGKLVYPFKTNTNYYRVGQGHYCPLPPSEPYVRVSPHTAQAFQSLCSCAETGSSYFLFPLFLRDNLKHSL